MFTQIITTYVVSTVNREVYKGCRRVYMNWRGGVQKVVKLGRGLGSSRGSIQEREQGTASMLMEMFLRQKEHLVGLRREKEGNN